MEEVRVVGAEETRVDLVNGLLQLWVSLVVLPRVVALEGMWREREVSWITSCNL